MHCWLLNVKKKELESQLSSYHQQMKRLEEELKSQSRFIRSVQPTVMQLKKQHDQLKSEFTCMKTSMLSMLTKAANDVSRPALNWLNALSSHLSLCFEKMFVSCFNFSVFFFFFYFFLAELWNISPVSKS